MEAVVVGVLYKGSVVNYRHFYYYSVHSVTSSSDMLTRVPVCN